MNRSSTPKTPEIHLPDSLSLVIETEAWDELSADKDVRRRARARDRALITSMTSGAIVRVISAVLGMAYFAISVRALSHVEFGALATIVTFTGLMAFADFGIGSGLMTRLAVAHGRDDEDAGQAVVSGAFGAMVAFGFMASLVGVTLAKVLPWSRILGMPPGYEAPAVGAVLAFAVCAGAAIPANIGQRVLIARQRAATANVWLLGSTLATLVAISVTAGIGAPLWAFVVALVGTPVLVSAVQTTWVLLLVYPGLTPRWRLVTRSSLWSLGRVSGLFMVLNLAVVVAYQSDMLIVASSLGSASAAVFAVGLRMFGVLSGVLSGASQQLWTSMAEALERGDQSWVRSRFLRVLAATTGAATAGCVVLIVAGRPLARLWAGDELVPSTGLIIAFAAWTTYSLAMTQVSALLNAAQIIAPQMVMALAMTMGNVLLSIYLTYHIGLLGPLVGSLTAHILCSGIPSIILARRVLRSKQPASEEPM